MREAVLTLTLLFLVAVAPASSADFGNDTIPTSAGDLVITFIGHGTLMFEFGDRVVHVDPWTRFTNYGDLPKADLILITHDHRDHFDGDAIAALTKDDTVVIVTQRVADALGEGRVMKNGESATVHGVKIEAVPAYNLVHMRPSGDPFHPKGAGNGYVMSFADARVYVAGDTENVPEMKALEGIDVAFIPMNLPYTMTPEMVADAVRAFRPTILYPYHYGQTDISRIVELLEDETDIEVRIRGME
jgi:L-ascorbate metabolism protein UlaG (beta-lactamase superfamily)